MTPRAIPPDMLDTIVTGDARLLAERIPNASVDLVFTDPVYDRIDDYQWLAETAARVLKPGGSVLAFAWGSAMRDVLVATSALEYHAMLSLYINNRTVDTRNKVGFNKWTPCVWLSRGDATSPRAADLLQCTAFRGNEYGNGSSNHAWSKAPEFFAYYIERFTDYAAVVYDPFTGGGTVPAVCKMLGRRYIASEIDPDTAELARERVRNTQPPLFVEAPEQRVMELAV